MFFFQFRRHLILLLIKYFSIEYKLEALQFFSELVKSNIKFSFEESIINIKIFKNNKICILVEIISTRKIQVS